MDCPLYVDCVVNEIEKRKQSHSNSKVDFSTKAKIYNAPCHLMYFCALILRTWDIEKRYERSYDVMTRNI